MTFILERGATVAFNIFTERGHMSISIIVPCFGQEKYLTRVLSSVIWQLSTEDEVIVINDSKKQFQDSTTRPFRDRVMFLKNDMNRGVSYSRNRGIFKSQADWIKLLDADDLLCPFVLDIVRGGIELSTIDTLLYESQYNEQWPWEQSAFKAIDSLATMGGRGIPDSIVQNPHSRFNRNAFAMHYWTHWHGERITVTWMRDTLTKGWEETQFQSFH